MILAASRGWLAIDKPAGASSHNAESAGEPDAIELTKNLLARDPALRATVQPEPGFVASPVHRLDAGTSGILILACDRAHARLWQKAFEHDEAEKTYVAVVKGQILAAGPADGGRWTWPLSDGAEGRRNPQGAPPYNPSTTIYRILDASHYLTLLEIALETGRTHQIRRHAALAKHPVAGDRRYGNPDHADLLQNKYGFHRLALHHRRLRARLAGKPVEIESPIPQEMIRLMHESHLASPSRS